MTTITMDMVEFIKKQKKFIKEQNKIIVEQIKEIKKLVERSYLLGLITKSQYLTPFHKDKKINVNNGIYG